MIYRLAAAALVTAFVAAPESVQCQATPKSYRVAIVANTVALKDMSDPVPDDSLNATKLLTDGLREYGWVEGKNIQFVRRSAEGHFERLPALFEEVARMPVDVIVAYGPGVHHAMKATRTIPIVMSTSAGIANIGWVDSLARPGVNVTGVSFETPPGLHGKRLELLKQAAPKVSRVALLVEGFDAARFQLSPTTRDAAAKLGMTLLPVGFDTPDQIGIAVAEAVKQGAHAILVGDGTWLYWRTHQETIHAAASRHRLPVVHSILGGAESGGLMAYGLDIRHSYRRLAYYVDKILRGAKAAELPVEQPDKLELVINLKAAKALGLALPASLVAQADRVIE